jgi:hypothetical protein
MRPALTEVQAEIVRSVSATLRLASRDKFLAALASQLSRCDQPLRDLDLKIAIRNLLGVTAVRDFDFGGSAPCGKPGTNFLREAD